MIYYDPTAASTETLAILFTTKEVYFTYRSLKYTNNVIFFQLRSETSQTKQIVELQFKMMITLEHNRNRA